MKKKDEGGIGKDGIRMQRSEKRMRNADGGGIWGKLEKNGWEPDRGEEKSLLRVNFPPSGIVLLGKKQSFNRECVSLK